jgi:hypothetical protein
MFRHWRCREQGVGEFSGMSADAVRRAPGQVPEIGRTLTTGGQGSVLQVARRLINHRLQSSRGGRKRMAIWTHPDGSVHSPLRRGFARC